ncbi:MAG TPA: hypothetical protein VK806_08490 [Bacteroidia bacterium]|jgi:hypothetical protein|nr:hypothetical protein [Bacteroidia bacterium]
MSRRNVIFLILFFKFAYTFGQNTQSFKIAGVKEKPALKSLTSASNTLYQGIDNVMILTDTLISAKRYIIKAPGTTMSWNGNRLLVRLSTPNLDTIYASICKTRGKDTLILYNQKLPVKRIPNGWSITLGGSVVMDTISKTKLLRYKKLGVCLDADIIKGFNAHITRFDMQIGNNTFHSDSNVLTPEMVKALQYSVTGTNIAINQIVIVGDPCPIVIADRQLRLIN